MGIAAIKPFEFGDKVIVDKVKGRITYLNEEKLTVQFSEGKVHINWSELLMTPSLLKKCLE